MLARIVGILSVLTLAILILGASILRVSSVNYAFYEPILGAKTALKTAEDIKNIPINYFLPYPGGILPDNSLWPLKALRDKVWLLLTSNSSRKAELNLLLSDKRLQASKTLFDKGKTAVAFSTLSKGEKYLEEAQQINSVNRKNGMDTSTFDVKLANAALKHRQIIEEVLLTAPEDAKPGIVKVLDYSKNAYKDSRDALQGKGIKPPEDPFDGE